MLDRGVPNGLGVPNKCTTSIIILENFPKRNQNNPYQNPHNNRVIGNGE